MTPRSCPWCGCLPTVSLVSRKTTRLTATVIRCESKDCSVHPVLGPIWNPENTVVAIWNRRKRKP